MSERSQTALDIDRKAAVDRVMQLIAIPGASGKEGAVVEYLKQQLRRLGVPASAITQDAVPRQSPIGGETGNLIVRLPGTRPGPRRLLMAHVDTVPLCVGTRPVLRNGMIRSGVKGRALGGDDRAGASVVLTALAELRRQKLPHPPLTLLWTVQEEIGLIGARYVARSKLGRPRMCFNWDGGTPNVATIGATGDVAVDITIHGIASHAGAHPEQGVSAAAIAGVAIADLVASGWHGLVSKGKQKGTSNIGVLHGGEATNVVLPQLELRAEVRSHNPRFRKRIVEAYRKAFERAAASVRSIDGRCGRVEFRTTDKYEAFRLAPNEPAVQTALAAIEAAGMEPFTAVSNGGLDANWLTAHGFPTVTLGCGQQEIHTPDEQLDVESYLAACRIALMIASGQV